MSIVRKEHIRDMNDVELTKELSDRDIFTYDSTLMKWTNVPDTALDLMLNDLNDVSISSPKKNDVLRYDEDTSKWTNVKKVTDDQVAAIVEFLDGNIRGATITPSTGITFAISEGRYFHKTGVADDVFKVLISPQYTKTPFTYVTQTGEPYTTEITDVNPTLLNEVDNIVTTIPADANTASVQYLFYRPEDNKFYMTIGQRTYSSVSRSQTHILNDLDAFITPPPLQDAFLIAGFMFEEDMNNMTDTGDTAIYDLRNGAIAIVNISQMNIEVTTANKGQLAVFDGDKWTAVDGKKHIKDTIVEILSEQGL